MLLAESQMLLSDGLAVIHCVRPFVLVTVLGPQKLPGKSAFVMREYLGVSNI